MQFTEFNTGKFIYVSHNQVSMIHAIPNANKGTCLIMDWGSKEICVAESPRDVATQLNYAEKQVREY